MATIDIKVKIDGIEYTQAELQKLAKASTDAAKATDDLTTAEKAVSKETDKSGETFKRVQTQIRETKIALQQAAAAGDKVKFEKLKGQLDELEDGLEKTQFQASQFDDQLASLPGPAGAAGNAIKSVDGLFKMLAANPIIGIIAIVAGLFMLLKKSMESTSEGQAVLNKMSEAFGKILGPIMLIVQKVAMPIFEALAVVIEKVGQAFEFFADALGFSEKQIQEASQGIEEVQEATAKREEALKKSIEDRMLAEQEELAKQKELAAKRIEAQKKRVEDQKSIDKSLEGLRVAALQDEALKLTEEVRLQKEAAIEEFKAKGASKEQIAQLEGFYDALALQKLGDFNTKKAADQKAVDDKAAADAEAVRLKKEADTLADQEKETARLAKLDEIDFLNHQASLETDGQRRQAAIDREEAFFMKELEMLNASEEQKTATVEFYATLRKEARRQEVENALQSTAQILGNLVTLAGEGSAIAKGAAIAQATINTFLGVSQVFADEKLDTFLKPFLAASILLLGLKQVQSIRKVAPPKFALGGMVGGLSHQQGGQLIEAEGGEFIVNKFAMQQPGVAQIAQALNSVASPASAGGGQMAPIRAFVVATEVSTAQEANQKVERLAKL